MSFQEAISQEGKREAQLPKSKKEMGECEQSFWRQSYLQYIPFSSSQVTELNGSRESENSDQTEDELMLHVTDVLLQDMEVICF